MSATVGCTRIRTAIKQMVTTAVVLTAAVLAAGVSAAPAWAEVTYSPLYWQLLDRYTSVQLRPGVYGSHPECLLAVQQSGTGGCMDLIVILNPDGTLGGGWIEDPAASNGWRPFGADDCPAWDDVDDPNWWLCYG